MAIPAITTRSGKGSALSYTEMDTNLTNLQNAVVQVTAGGTTSNIALNSGLSISNSSNITAVNSAGTLTLDLADVGTAGTYIATTVDAKGRTTGGSNVIVQVSETVYAIGNSGATTVSVNANNGTVQTITATGNFTINAANISNLTSGKTVTLIIRQDATGSRTLTSDLKFAGASKTLSTAASSIDSITIFYDGTNYLASLVKGYA